jgi:hypothetical protein
VNLLAADPFRVPSNAPLTNVIPGVSGGWERPLGTPGMLLQPDGSVTRIKRP